MKKYNTKPIDFTGCHPVIAEALKRGEAIECRVWDGIRNKGREAVVWICQYRNNSSLPYLSESNTPWKNAEPITLKTRRIMPPERAIPMLIAKGFAFTSEGWLIGNGFTLTPQMYAFMGNDLDVVVNESAWPSYIIEEVEDDE